MENTYRPPSASWEGGEKIWALVPNLTFSQETEKAILFQQGIQEPCWIPKSQIHFDLWAASSCFVGIAQWIAVKRGLESYGILVGNTFALSWLRSREATYVTAEKGKKEEAKEREKVKLWQVLKERRLAEQERLLSQRREEAKEQQMVQPNLWESLKVGGANEQKIIFAAQVAQAQTLLEGGITLKEYIRRRIAEARKPPTEKPAQVLPKRTRAMNIHDEDD